MTAPHCRIVRRNKVSPKKKNCMRWKTFSGLVVQVQNSSMYRLVSGHYVTHWGRRSTGQPVNWLELEWRHVVGLQSGFNENLNESEDTMMIKTSLIRCSSDLANLILTVWSTFSTDLRLLCQCALAASLVRSLLVGSPLFGSLPGQITTHQITPMQIAPFGSLLVRLLLFKSPMLTLFLVRSPLFISLGSHLVRSPLRAIVLRTLMHKHRRKLLSVTKCENWQRHGVVCCC